MKTILLASGIFGLLSLLVIEYVAGSSWGFVTKNELALYKSVGAPISTLPVAVKIAPGKRLEVVQCFFDKNDAYLLVKDDQGNHGYTFDNRHAFVRSWRPVELGPNLDFGGSLTCMRLTGQFGD